MSGFLPPGTRQRCERWLSAIWYGDQPVPWWLLLLEGAYRFAYRLRHWLYLRGWLPVHRLPVPVLVVGNLTVGGTGKTPLTLWLVEQLRHSGWRPGIVLRGYGGAHTGPLILGPDSTPAQVGDEAVLLSRRSHVPVAIGRRRPAAALALLAQQRCDVVVADDGLQHWALARDVEVVVVDGQRGWGNRRLLPAGPLREPVQRLQQVDFVVVNGGMVEGGDIGMRVQATHLHPLAHPAQREPLEEWRGRQVHAVAGIGHPERFFSLLEGHGLRVVRHSWPDHHAFTGAELHFPGDDWPVLITEKDAVKCAPHHPNVYVVPIDAVLPDGFAGRIDALLRERLPRTQ